MKPALLPREPDSLHSRPQAGSWQDASPSLRRRVSEALEGGRAQIGARWARRHLDDPALSARAGRELSGAGTIASSEDYRMRYLEPLLRLLIAFVREPTPVLGHVFHNERRRYLDRDALLTGEGIEQIAASLSADAEDVRAVLDWDPVASEAARTVLEELDAPLLSGEEAVTVAMVGDCLMAEIDTFLAPRVAERGVRLGTRHFYISALLGIGAESDEVLSFLSQTPVDLIALSFLTYDGIAPYRALLAEAGQLRRHELAERVGAIEVVIRDYVQRLRETTVAPVLLHGACGLPLRRFRKRLGFLPPHSTAQHRALALLTDRLRELAGALENVIFIDEAAVVGRRALRAADRPALPPGLARASMFHTSRLGTILAQPYADVVMAYRLLSRCKVLLVDFDDTLWRGVMAEAQVEHDLRAQQLLRRLREAGILLVAVSKNDPESIRWEELAVARDDFVLHKVGWNQKAQSIEESASQLDLDPASFVLIDDNPAERALVGEHLPQVTALDPADPFTWRALELMLQFPNTRGTAEAARRTEAYREQAARREAISGQIDYEQMMASLSLEAAFGRARSEDLDRVHELVARTTQFNTTTLRRSRAELAAFLEASDRTAYVASLLDKFGDLGIVGVVLVTRDGHELVFDSVIMSCRAMGFGLETVLLRAAIDAEPAAQRALGRYLPTDRNCPCAGLFAGAGFTQISDREWSLELSGELPEIPSWLALRAR
jgi:FkbH-like protein